MSLGGAPQSPPAAVSRADSDADTRPVRVISDPPLLWVLVQLTALSFYRPLIVLGGPQRAVTSLPSALLVGLAVTAASFGVHLLLSKTTRSKWIGLAWTSVGLMFFWNWEGATFVETPLPWIVSVGLLALTLAGVRKWANYRYFRYGVLVTSSTLLVTLTAVVVHDELTTPPPSIVITDPSEARSFVSTPDIYLILLDGYARQDVLQSLFEFDNADFISDLEDRGLSVASSANSNYGSTHFSLPSLLEMSYLTEENQQIHNSDLVEVTRMIGGDNTWIETLKANGYTYIHGDTEHWLNRCGNNVDVCLTGPRLDITVDALLAKTPVGGLLYPESGDPTTALNRQRLSELANWTEIAADLPSGPRFALVHLVLPHPPLFLDASCSPRVDPDFDGRNISDETFPLSLRPARRQAYVEQVQCANRTVLEFLDQIDHEAVVVVTADHGPDSLGPLNIDPRTWTKAQQWERFSILSALRLPDGCDAGGDDRQLVNTLRLVVECLSGSEVPMLDGRWFAASYSGTVVQFKDTDQNVEAP